MNQGDLYLANLNPIVGHEQAGLRPVLILQSGILNEKLNTIVIVPLTSNLKYDHLLTTFLIKKEWSHLSKDSVALLHHIRAIDKIRLKKKIGTLNDVQLNSLKLKLMNVFYTS